MTVCVTLCLHCVIYSGPCGPASRDLPFMHYSALYCMAFFLGQRGPTPCESPGLSGFSAYTPSAPSSLLRPYTPQSGA